MPKANLPACRLCDHKDLFLGAHLQQEHDLSILAYLEQHPNAPVASKPLLTATRKNAGKVRRVLPCDPEELTVNFGGVKCHVNWDVPADACLKEPDHYRIPQVGPLAKDIAAAALYLKRRRSTYIWGPQGAGKDGFVHAWSALTRTPAEKFQISPGTDIQPWLWTREVSPERGTYYQEGRLLKLARDGYTTRTGRKVPALILVTDGDRATKSQAETFRLLLDTIEGRVPRWDGGSWPVFPGTLFVVTANTAGQGDETGRYVSSNIIDSTILARFQRFRQFGLMAWKDEEPILRAKFPFFASKMGHMLEGAHDRVTGQMTTGLGSATRALREAIVAEDLYADFSHRELCNWIEAAQDILEEHPGRKVPKALMREAGRAVFDKFPDNETRLRAKRLIHGFITGGMLDPGHAEEEKPDELGAQETTGKP